MVSAFVSLAASLAVATLASAQGTHTVTFKNNCGHGFPVFILGGQIVANNTASYTHTGDISGAISYLQTGQCLFNGENCLLMEMTLNNPTCNGCGSSADISLINPHKFNVPTSFQFYGADGSCDGLGASCADANCDTAFFQSDDNQVQRSCQKDNINMLITYCGSTSTEFINPAPNSLSGANTPQGNPGNGSPPPPPPPAKPTTTSTHSAPPTTTTKAESTSTVKPSPSSSSSPSHSPEPISEPVKPSSSPAPKPSPSSTHSSSTVTASSSSAPAPINVAPTPDPVPVSSSSITSTSSAPSASSTKVCNRKSPTPGSVNSKRRRAASASTPEAFKRAASANANANAGLHAHARSQARAMMVHRH